MHIRSMSLSAEHMLDCMGIAACLAALWAVSCYFVGRSHENNITNLMTCALPVLALVGLALVRIPALPQVVAGSYRVIMAALFSIVANVVATDIIGGYSPQVRTDTLGDHHAPVVSFFHPITTDLTALFPPEAVTPPALLNLIHAAGIPTGANILSLDEMDNRFDLHARSWLLPDSVPMLGYNWPLTPSRAAFLAMRRAARGPEEGWLIESISNPLEHNPWIRDAVNQYYTEASRVENADYRVRRFRRKVP
jgi:hypothetical protein